MFERFLSIAEQSQDPDHSNTAMALSELAILHSIEGDTQGATALFKRELAIREKIHGPEHARVAQTLNNLAIQAH